MNLTSSSKSRDVSNLHTEIFDFLCTYHRVKRIPSKDTNPGAIVQNSLSNEQRGELINRSLYKILNAVELRISVLPSTSEPTTSDYFDEWAFLTWTLLSIINRLQSDARDSSTFLDYGGKHFQEKINTALVELVNKAQRMQPPAGVQPNDTHFDRFYQAYVTTLITLHDLYTMFQQKWLYSEFETQIGLFKDQLTVCFQLQREFCNNHGYLLWRQMRESQVRKMTTYGYDNKGYLESAMSFYSNMLYNLGVLAARLQGFCYETRNSKVLSDKPDLIAPLLQMVYSMVEILLSDAIISVEPSQNAILVTNNLFPMKIVSLCRCSFFKEFSLQIVSEEVAQQIQQEMRHRKTFEPPVPIRPTPSAALLALKPSTGIKRNNATASADGGGNTAHKKSDVSSKEWISIPPSFDPEQGGWVATYPHLLCTTRQKDNLLDSRSGQTGKRPLFYFHVKAEMFSFTGDFATAHTLSLPFSIATRRNQDCQVQRMMSSYTATCFWLYGTNVIDGLTIGWYDHEIDWKHFKHLYAQYFALNAEVLRSLTDEDFAILRLKMHCPECTERTNEENFSNPTHIPNSVTFKNVLCPHLHYRITEPTKVDLRFSIWRGMLELLHLFNDQRTEVKNLWECGLLQGFMEMETVHSLLVSVDHALIMRLSFVIGGSICFTVKSNGHILNLEPLDIRRLQAKPLNEYLRDILLAEKVEYVLNSKREWIHVSEAVKLCQKASTSDSSYNLTTKEVTSNVMYAGPVEEEQIIRFTPMRVAVVTCKQPAATDYKLDTSSNARNLGRQMRTNPSSTSLDDFEAKLESLTRAFGKSSKDVLDWVGKRKCNQSTANHITLAQPQTSMSQAGLVNSIASSSSMPHLSINTSLMFGTQTSSYLTQAVNSSPSCNGHAPPIGLLQNENQQGNLLLFPNEKDRLRHWSTYPVQITSPSEDLNTLAHT
ncbi:hypothetical protein DdX_03371 [Ditylenchus destructor]|uniref:Uncharacterized protein n=1 Tax=Ditylenchus destructor TaxID=166010 RepID=A0AAD4RCY8_9BILA|nr:hypothetical protein DdX_03371 [Ditylenchus destructor]